MGKYFGTDGFRGEANVDLNPVHAFKIGRYLGWYYGRDHKAKIVIGKDTRRSSYMFENALAAATVLTAYIPMLMDTGGNSGSQASVTVIRGISLNDIEFSDFFRVVWKEIRVAALCGVALAAVNFVKLLLVDGMLFHNEAITVPVAAVICLTMVCTILCAKLVGCTLPMLAEKLGFDPAVMSSPFITTIVDALSLLIYFRFATWILRL